MRPLWRVVIISIVTLAASVYSGSSVDDLRAEVNRLRKDITAKEEANASQNAIGGVDKSLRGKYGPRQAVGIKSTEGIKLEIQGLLQVWFQSVQNDNIGITTQPLNFPTNDPSPNVLQEQNELLDNDTFRIRRAELRFSMEISENISAFIMIDPSREHNPSFYPLPTLPRHNVPSSSPSAALREGVIEGRALKPRLLQDAYISFDGLVPHHSFAIGQFKPPSGEEASRNSGQLDFVERSMVTGINNVRDIGAMVTGFWLNDRIRYSFGLFNGPSGTILSDPEIVEAGNRSDDNDEKDFAFRLAVRPVWSTEKWYGRLELGYHRTEGVHGEAGRNFDPDFVLNAVNETRTAINRQGAWAFYRPGGPAKGMWLRGEWGAGRDRFGADDSFTALFGIGSVDLGVTGARGSSGFTQANPAAVNVSGWYFGTGYRLADSIFGKKLKEGGQVGRVLNNLEFAFRYEAFENVNAEDLLQSDRHTDQFKTQVYTAGINYYIKGRETKLQINYLFVDDPSSGNPLRGFREVRNDVLVVNFQLGF